jgi:hypothetical protein
MLTLFLISVVGFSIVHRILSSIAGEFALTQRNFVVASVMCLLIFVSSSALLHNEPFILWLFIGILLITLKFSPNILRFFLERKLMTTVIPFLDAVILGLQAGQSFRSSLHVAIESQQGWIRNQLRDLYNSVVMSDEVIDLKSALLADLREEFREIDRSQMKCVDQLRALRRQLKMREDFRRRSGQVTQQIKAQAIIVTALFCALAGFVIAQFGWKEHSKLILLSSLVFILGLTMIFLIGKRFKWNV